MSRQTLFRTFMIRIGTTHCKGFESWGETGPNNTWACWEFIAQEQGGWGSVGGKVRGNIKGKRDSD